MEFSVNRNLDTTALAARFASDGFVQIAGVLQSQAAQFLHQALFTQTPWNLVFADRGKHVDLSGASLAGMSPEQRGQLQQAIHAQARTGFQYCYNNYPIFDAVRAGHNEGHPLHRFCDWLNADSFLQLVRTVTGFDDISFVDAQATRYAPGHFLTTHDDSQQGKRRRAAYVFNFTPHWCADWGGYLQLLDAEDNVRIGLRPAFNVLNVIAVPQKHNVSIVAPFAGAARLSITGWLRYGAPD